MEAPFFDYSKISPDRSPSDSAPSTVPVIESASASTANQSNDSNFAYILTAVVLGGIALFAIALTWLGFGIVQTAVSESHPHRYREELNEEESWDRYADELDEFEDRLWDEYYSNSHMDA